jgi:hypothetical protein
MPQYFCRHVPQALESTTRKVPAPPNDGLLKAAARGAPTSLASSLEHAQCRFASLGRQDFVAGAGASK